jgi:hypothetical protein
MSENSGMTFQQLKERLGPSVTREELLKTAKTLSVQVPLRERIYTKTHRPKGSEADIDFVVVPNPVGGRDLWVRKSEFPALLADLNAFAQDIGLAGSGQ